MKKGNITFIGILMMGLVIGLLTINAGAVGAQEKKVELKAISFMPANVTKSKLFKEFLSRVEKASNGELSMKYLGGPEVIGLPEQGQAVGRGTVDMAMLPPSVIQGMVPEANATILSRGLTQEEEIERGVIGKLQPFHNKANLYCLGEIFGLNAPQFMLYTRKKIEKLSDMKGIATGMNGPMFKPAADALGLVMKVVPFSEAYTALERKVVEGWFSSNSAITSFAGQEQLKFCVDHAVFVDPTLVVVNLAKWNSLSKSAQNALQKTMMESYSEFGRLNTEDETNSIEVCKKAGIQYVKLPPADAQVYLDTIYNAMWSDMEKKMPGSVPELRKLLTK